MNDEPRELRRADVVGQITVLTEQLKKDERMVTEATAALRQAENFRDRTKKALTAWTDILEVLKKADIS